MPGAHQAAHSTSSTGQGRGNTTKGSWVKIRTGRDHSSVGFMDKRDSAWGNNLI